MRCLTGVLALICGAIACTPTRSLDEYQAGGGGAGRGPGGAAGSGASGTAGTAMTGGAAGGGGAATCDDSVMNGAETGVDCGGLCPKLCAPGEGCVNDRDCDTDFCKSGTCATPSCDDGFINGDETDRDCGGSCPMGCADGQECDSPTDCESTHCTGGKCEAASCSDDALNGTETDVDCGGECSMACGDGEGCATGTDCESKVCEMMKCAIPTCTDGVANGAETDADCGASCPTKCAAGRGCMTAMDCTSGVCSGGVCVGAGCADGVMNGTETGVDCGGSCAPAKKCAIGSTCGDGDDCRTAFCDMGTCQEAPCGDVSGCTCLRFGDHAYQFCGSHKDAAEASAKCAEVGMVLVRIDDSAENEFVRANGSSDLKWIGGSDASTEGQWRWSDGEQYWQGAVTGAPVGGLFTNWGTQEPNDLLGEDCSLIQNTNGKWADRGCESDERFVCEYY